MLRSILNPVTLIRVWALFSRFLVIGLAAYALTAGEFGQWSLVSTAIALLCYIIGMDLYAPAVRSLYTAKSKAEAVNTMASLALVYGVNFSLICAFLVFSPPLRSYALGTTSLALAIPLLISEHLSAEANRQLNLLGNLKQANIVLLVRSSVPAALFGLSCLLGSSDLTTLLLCQIIGTAAALWPAFYYLKRHIHSNFADSPVADSRDQKTLLTARSLIKGCGAVFLTTCFLKTTQTVDRQFLANIADLPRVGAYSLIMAAAAAITSAIDAVLVSTSISKLMNAAAANNYRLLRPTYQQLRKHLLILSSGLHLCAFFAFVLFSTFLAQDKYEIKLTEVAILLSASFISNCSLAEASLLFSTKKDRASLLAAIAGLGILLIGILSLKSLIGPDSVAWAVLLASTGTWFSRQLAAKSIFRTSAQVHSS